MSSTIFSIFVGIWAVCVYLLGFYMGRKSK